MTRVIEDPWGDPSDDEIRAIELADHWWLDDVDLADIEFDDERWVAGLSELEVER